MSPRDVVMTTRTATGELLTYTPGKAGGDGPKYWEMREHLQNNGGWVDWDFWLNLSQWTPTEAACLADAVDPSFWQRPPDMKRYNNEAHAHTRPASDEIEKIERWCQDKSEAPLSPDAWVRILRERGYSLPPALAGLGADEPAQDEPSKAKSRRTHTQQRTAVLAALLDEIESRARDVGHPFDRAEWPGTKDEFRAFLRWHCPKLAHTLPADNKKGLSKELSPFGVKFAHPGRDKTKGLTFYRAIFPDYRPA